MTTIVEKTIGTGGDYATPALWIAACPPNLVTVDQIWRGKLKNQEFTSSASNMCAITGITTNASCYVELTADTGASYRDHASHATNPLRYDATKGASMRHTSGYYSAISVAVPYTRISNIQLANLFAGTNGFPNESVLAVNAANCLIENMIMEGTVYSNSGVCSMYGNSNIVNCTVIQRITDTTRNIASLMEGAKATNCGFVSLGATLAFGIRTQYSAATLRNCYVMGVVLAEDGVTACTKVTSHFNGTATGYTNTPLSTSTFENITSGSHDMRLKAGSALIDVGTLNTTYGTTDFMGNARPSGGGTDIGAYEYLVADVTAPTLSAPSGTQTGATTATVTVATNEGNGTLYAFVSTSPTATASQVKAGGSTQAVTTTGTKTFSITGLNASTAYYSHFLHTDAAGNDSAVVDGTGFTTASTNDVTAPTMNGSITPGAITLTSLAFSYLAGSDNVAIGGYQISKDSGVTWVANGTNLTGSFSGLTASTTYQIWVRAFDNAGTPNFSTPLTLSMTTSSPATGSFVTDQLEEAGSLRSNQSVVWTWFAGGVIGTTLGTATHGSSILSGLGVLTASGLPLGAGYMMIKSSDGGIAYQSGTVV